MGLMQDLWEKYKNKDSEEPREEIPDDMTRDKYLRSLRREDRVMDEEEEKIYLKKKIELRRKQKLKEHLFGIKEGIERKQNPNSSFLGKTKL